MLTSLQPTKKYFLVMFFISLVLLEILILIVFKQSQISQESGQRLIRSYDILRLERQSMIDTMNLVNDERGYMLTGRPSAVQAYNATRVKLDSQLNELNSVVSEELSSDLTYQNISTLHDKIRNLETVTQQHVDNMRHPAPAGSLKPLALETQALVDEIRSAYESLTQNVGEKIKVRRIDADQKYKNYLWTLGIGTVLELGILAIGNLVIISLVARNARAKQELRRSEELFEIILNGLHDGVFDYNIATGNIIYSPSYQKMLGYEAHELGGKQNQFYNFVHPDDIDDAVFVMDRFLNDQIPQYNNTFRVRHKDGRWLWVMSRGVAVRGPDNKIVRLIGTHTDITVQKQREAELAFFMQENETQSLELAREKEKAEAANEAKSNFLATMSHEIRTPMNAVVGLSTLMMKTKLDSKQQKMMDTISANADILLSLVNDLLDISRIEAQQIHLETRPFTFDGIFQALTYMFETQITAKGLHFEIDNQVGKESFLGDPARLQQVLINLVGNALKFTQEGYIALRSHVVEHKDDMMKIDVTVSDTGVGIAPDKLDRVFNKFEQADQTISRRFGGSGLGLAISKSLVQLMNGTISVTSTLHRGSVFKVSISLQINSKPAVKRVKKQMTAEAIAPIGTILIVEDYAPNVMVATLMLENLGFAADVANNGLLALQKVEQCTEAYAAILMDVQMQGMDGYETTRQIRAIEQRRGFRHSIIGLTAHALAGDEEKCLNAGMDDYMTKPINLDLLSEKLKITKAA